VKQKRASSNNISSAANHADEDDDEMLDVVGADGKEDKDEDEDEDDLDEDECVASGARRSWCGILSLPVTNMGGRYIVEKIVAHMLEVDVGTQRRATPLLPALTRGPGHSKI
jgi:hypothetical protein